MLPAGFLLNLDTFYLETGNPRILYIAYRYLSRNDDTFFRVIYIAQFTFVRYVPLFQHSILVLVGKAYRHLLVRRGTSARDVFYVQYDMFPPVLLHVSLGLLIYLYHRPAPLSFIRISVRYL